ncbi:MAG: peroxiredoxin [Sphingobacteriales bacterium]|jgi:peroxiredoxin
MKTFQLILVCCLFACANGSVFSQESNLEKFGIETKTNVPKGLTKGENAPNFRGVNQNGEKITLSGLLSEGPVVLVFYRGYWCGYCNRHLAELQAELAAFSDMGVKVVAVTPENKEGVNKTIAKTSVSFDIISDHDGSIMESFGVGFQVNKSYQKKMVNYIGDELQDLHESGEAVLPIPATYVIGTNGQIIKSFFNPDYSERSSLDEIKKALKK